jgi:hypothetical protein
MWSWDSSVGIAMGGANMGFGVGCRQGRIFFALPQRPDFLSITPSFLPDGEHGVFSQG